MAKSLLTSTMTIHDLMDTLELEGDFHFPKGSKPPPDHGDLVAAKALAAIALIGICALIAMNTISIFRIQDFGSKWKQQMSNRAGRVLFAFYIIALALNLSSCITFVDLIWTDLRLPHYGLCLMFYDSGRWCMSMFFLFRLYFIVRQTTDLRVRTWKLVVLVILLTASWFLGLWVSIGSIFKWKKPHPSLAIIQYGVIALCDIIVMFLYCHRLLTVVIMRAEIQDSQSPMYPLQSHEQITAEGDFEFSVTESGSLQYDVVPLSKPSVLSVPSSSVQTVQSSAESTRSNKSMKLKVTVDQKFVNVITKSTILNLIGALSTLMFIGYLGYLRMTDTKEPTLPALRCLDGVINTICVFLTFGFSHRYYNFGCKYCHREMRRCCKKLPKSAVRRSHQSLQLSASL